MVAPAALAVSPSSCEIIGDVSLHWEGFEDGVSHHDLGTYGQNNDYWRLEIDRIENTTDRGYGWCNVYVLLSPDPQIDNASGWWLAVFASTYPGADGGTTKYEGPGSYVNDSCYLMDAGDYCTNIVIAGPNTLRDNSGCDERHTHVFRVSGGCSQARSMPAVPPGDYYVHIGTGDVQNPDNPVQYYDHRTVPGTFRIGDGGDGGAPDLRVDDPSLNHTSRVPGGSFTLSAVVRNGGNATADATQLRFYRSSNSAISTSDTQVGTASVRGLAASASSTESASLRAPSNPGTYYYGACVDAVSGESATHNNCSTAVTLRVVEESGGDHGDSQSDATIVSADSTTQGELEQGGDVDYFRIDLERPGTLTVETTGPTDTYGTLTGPGGTIAANDDSGAGLNFKIYADIEQASVYYVAVRGYSTRTVGAYTLVVAFEPEDDGFLGPTVTHVVPLVPSAGQPAQNGYVRVVNRSNRAGRVRIHATDDAGGRAGPVTLSLRANATQYFESNDLEYGNSARGLSSGVGSGRGDWRLALETDLDILVLAYISTSEGFLTSVHDLVPDEGGRHYVAIFNPASDYPQRSLLRLVNPSEVSAQVIVDGLDDSGGAPPLGRVSLVLPAGEARTLTADELENGGTGLEGRLGDGSGKWQLFVTASAPIQAMSLMVTPTGGLTNLSTLGIGAEAQGEGSGGVRGAQPPVPIRMELFTPPVDEAVLRAKQAAQDRLR